jgi:dUTP pyrophosphatase
MRYLKDKDIAAALEQQPPLVEGVTDLANQLQPNGIDLTVAAIVRVVGAAHVGFSSDETRPAPAEALEFDADGWLFLPRGNYRARLAERVNIPPDIVGFARARSTMIRNGISVNTAIWDSGYSGYSEVGLVVHNEHGLYLKRGARILQMYFFQLDDAVDKAYNGRYQGEHIGSQPTDCKNG